MERELWLSGAAGQVLPTPPALVTVWSRERGLRNVVLGTWSRERGLRNMVSGMWSLECSLRNMVLGMRSREHGLWNVVLGTWSPEHGLRSCSAGELLCLHEGLYPPHPHPGGCRCPAVCPGILLGPGRILQRPLIHLRWGLRPPLRAQHSETLLKIISCALRLLHLQKLENVLQDLPPWPALKRLLPVLGALRNAIAQNLRFVQGKLAGSHSSPTH